MSALSPPGVSPAPHCRIPVLPLLGALLAALLVLPAPARATTYYVDAAGSGAGGTTWTTAFTTVQAGLAAAQNGDTVEISGGTYVENLVSQRAGVVVSGSTTSGHNGTVTVKGGSGQTVLTVNHQTTWRRIVFDGSANTDPGVYVVWIENAASPTFDQCVIGPGQRLLNIKAGGASFTRSTIRDSRVAGSAGIIYINAGTSDVSFSYCLLADAGYGYIQAQTAGRVDCNNCLLAGFGGSVLYIDPTAAIPGGVFWTNCLVMANGVKSSAIIENDSPTIPVTLANCLVHPRTPFNLTAAKYIGTVNESAALSGTPLLTHGRRKALINIGIDDESSIGFWDQIATECDLYGFKTTLALNTAVATSGDWQTLQGHVNGGHEVASHTAHHVYLAGPSATPNAKPSLFQLRYTGSGTQATLAIDRSVSPPLLTVTVAGDSGADVSLPLSSTGAYPTVADVKAVFDAMPTKYTFSLTTVSGSSYNSGRWLSQDMEAVAAADIKTAAVTVSVDDAAASLDELTVPKQTIEANLRNASGGAYSCDALVYPYEGTGAWAIAAAHAAGYLVARSSADGDFAMGSPNGYNMLNVFCTEPHLIFGTTWTEAQLRDEVSAVLEWAKFNGLAISLFSHNQAGEFTFPQWQTLLKIMAEDPEIQVATLRQLYDFISANGQSLDGGVTYNRTTAWPDVANYVPQYASQLVRAGAPYSVGMIDFGGNAVAAGVIPNVGLYQARQSNPGRLSLPAINTLLLLQ